jgi:GntR family transcriptional regulator
MIALAEMSGLTRHEQVSDWLRTEILSGAFAEGHRLPSESSLTARFAVSRITVRRALQTLENEGLIVRRQGVGSFVASRVVDHGLVRLTDFEEEMRQVGLRARSEVVSRRLLEAPVAAARALGLAAGTTTCTLERIRLANDVPIAFDTTWLPVFYGQLLEGRDLEIETIYSILEDVRGIPVVLADLRIEALRLGSDVASHLTVECGSVGLLVERISYTVSERPVYFQRRYYCGDRIAFDLQLERTALTGPSARVGLPLTDIAAVEKSEVSDP